MPSPLVLADGTQDQPIGPIMPRVRRFAFQSYFSTALGPTALLPQPTNSEGFVSSTVVEEQLQGYGLALHPDSECPVAVQFRGGSGDSGTYVLKPGQRIRPNGYQGGAFEGFKWGLPFGWLGGGVAHLLVMLTPDAEVDLPGQAEVVIHRVRLPVIAPAGAFSADTNWPLRFPWPDAIATLGGVLVDQRGDPILSPKPTRTLLRLVNDTLAAPAAMRIVWTATDDLDLGGISGEVLSNNSSYLDMTWPAIGVSPPAAYPVITIEGPEVNLGGDFCKVTLFDIGGGEITGDSVDIVRYGLL